jgi:hypothetical protein
MYWLLTRSYAESVLGCDDAQYLSTLFITPTSVLVESVFSVHVWTDRRETSTLPYIVKSNRR